ncbi:MAG: hypothetical protein ACE5KZ_10585 [Candidatus Scalinduaceae bacterium]
MKEKPAIVVEFDGVICENKFPDVGEPIGGVREALNTLKRAGYRIIIHSRRTSSYLKNKLICNQYQWIADYMEYYKLYYDDIWLLDKPIAVAYIDDKALNFYNNWEEITEQIIRNAARSWSGSALTKSAL